MNQNARIEKVFIKQASGGGENPPTFDIGNAHYEQDSALFRIYNSAGSYIEIGGNTCTLQSMFVHDRNKQLRNILSGGGNLLFGGVNAAISPVWYAEEGEDNSVVISSEVQIGDASVSLEVCFRLKDFDRLVIDYSVRGSSAVYMTHCLSFCLDDGTSANTHKMRVFAAEELDDCGVGQLRNVMKDACIQYLPVSEGVHIYANPGKKLRPFAELFSEQTDLALSAYTTMETMWIEKEDPPHDQMSFCAKPNGGECADQIARTVYGVDLLHQGAAINPLLFFTR